MKPETLKTKIFLDSGDPKDTESILFLLGFLDGQTTNPSLIAVSPGAKERLLKGEKFSKKELFDLYKETVQQISSLIPEGSVSVEVYADKDTGANEMYEQGKEIFSWIKNAHIKYPTNKEGLKATERSIKEGMRVNMTLCFTQEQAAAVYSATMGAKKGDVFISPFVGRLDDRGENGMQLIENILKMYTKGDGHVEVLTASVRNLNHFMAAINLGSDIITAPMKILIEWQEVGSLIPTKEYMYEKGELTDIPYKELNLKEPWQEFNIRHELTDKGIERFAEDWNNLIQMI